MFRSTTLILAVIMCIVALVPITAEPTRDPSALSFSSDEDTFPEDDPEQERTTDVLGFGSLLFAIRNQFKDIIIEIGIQVVKYVVKCLHEFKVKLLKRLGKYTLSDVFHFIFDGVTDFVVESEPLFYEPVREPVKAVVKPSYDSSIPYEWSPLFARQSRDMKN